MKTPYYFGFGSLVNEQTLPVNTRWHKATLSGWRRSWRHPIAGEPSWAAMDVIADANSSIDGLLVTGGTDIDEYLIKREAGYNPHELSHLHLCVDGELHAQASPCLWTSKHSQQNNEPLWLMQSYVDVVMSGYLRHFGEAGLERFVMTTDNWHLPVYDDRLAPRYPRSVQLSDHEVQIITALQPKP